jgi:hypothetical protein
VTGVLAGEKLVMKETPVGKVSVRKALVKRAPVLEHCPA